MFHLILIFTRFAELGSKFYYLFTWILGFDFFILFYLEIKNTKTGFHIFTLFWVYDGGSQKYCHNIIHSSFWFL